MGRCSHRPGEECEEYQARGGRRHLPERSGAAALRHGSENCENEDDDEGDDTCLECSGAAALRHGSENCENKDAAAAAQIQRDGYDENVDDEDMPATDQKGSQTGSHKGSGGAKGVGARLTPYGKQSG